MPITITQALDLPVAVVLLMFIPIGLWRGALREWVACAGIAFGTILAEATGARWGESFAQFANMDPKLGSFAVATTFFLASTLLIGYGGGLALPYRPDLSWLNRGLGALLGLGNGFLIVGGLLRLMQARLFDGRSNSPLYSASLTAFLVNTSAAWVYLGLFLAFALCVILAVVRRVNDGTPLFEEYSPVYQVTSQGDWASATRWEPQSPAAETWSADVAAVAPATAAQPTQILQLVTTPDTSTAKAAPNGAPPAPAHPGQPAKAIANIARPAARPASKPTGNTDRLPRPVEPVNGNDAPTLIPRPAAEARPRREAAPAPTTTSSCPICSAPLPGEARFCSACGHIVGAAERRQIARQR